MEKIIWNFKTKKRCFYNDVLLVKYGSSLHRNKLHQSFIRKSLNHDLNLSTLCIKKVGGNGLETNFLYDFWLKFGPIPNSISGPLFQNDLSLSVREFIINIHANNNFSFSFSLHPNIINEIIATPISISLNSLDNISWLPSSDGIFSNKSAFNLIYSNIPQFPSLNLNWIWKFKIHPKLKIFLCKLCNKGLNSTDKLHNLKILNSPIFSLCISLPESIPHLFLNCSFTINIWKSFNLPPAFFSLNFNEWFSKSCKSNYSLQNILWKKKIV